MGQAVERGIICVNTIDVDMLLTSDGHLLAGNEGTGDPLQLYHAETRAPLVSSVALMSVRMSFSVRA